MQNVDKSSNQHRFFKKWFDIFSKKRIIPPTNRLWWDGRV